MSGLIIYASKYGSTAQYARLIAEKLDTEALAVSEGLLTALSRTHVVVLGSPIYGSSVLPDMECFLRENREILAEKALAAFVVCGDTLWNPEAGEGGHRNFEKLTKLLPSKPFAGMVLGGRMRMEELDDEDGPKIRAFYERIGREATGFDRMDTKSLDPFIDRIRRFLVHDI
jgi:menaquinone-dependent protoporphyrinogen IX oxidase